ncbi:MAG: hypothetical protein LBD62_00575, partial [Candidatus Margulisbacteria bacterium]|nr:hypothetical protein [Candidatus Margulisiibacteriota bacterium]
DVFPHGTEFRVYEGHIPVALIPTPTGGAVCLAFDTQTPRGFPIGSFTKSDAISYPEFQQLQEISRI